MGRPFLRADTLLKEGDSVTHRFDCNTVGPVPVASGYGSRTLTHSAAYVLEGSKHNASALSSKHEKIHTQFVDSDVKELSKTRIGDSERFSNVNSGPTRGSYAVEGVSKIPLFTGSHLRLEKDRVLQRQKAFNSMPKLSCFTYAIK